MKKRNVLDIFKDEVDYLCNLKNHIEDEYKDTSNLKYRYTLKCYISDYYMDDKGNNIPKVSLYLRNIRSRIETKDLTFKSTEEVDTLLPQIMSYYLDYIFEDKLIEMEPNTDYSSIKPHDKNAILALGVLKDYDYYTNMVKVACKEHNSRVDSYDSKYEEAGYQYAKKLY